MKTLIAALFVSFTLAPAALAEDVKPVEMTPAELETVSGGLLNFALFSFVAQQNNSTTNQTQTTRTNARATQVPVVALVPVNSASNAVAPTQTSTTNQANINF